MRSLASFLVACSLAIALSPTTSQAQVDASQQFDCPALYQSGEHRGAALCFEQLVEQGNHNGHLLYNQGNAWYRAGETGAAIHAYRRALLHIPRDGDLKANLRSARERVRDDLPPPDGRGPVLTTVLAPYDALSASELLLVGSILWALTFCLLILRMRGAVPGSSGLAAFLGLLAILALVGYAFRSYEERVQPIAVVLAEEILLRSGRDLQSTELARLHEGAEVRVVEQGEAWTQVGLSTGQRGWLPTSGLGLVQP